MNRLIDQVTPVTRGIIWSVSSGDKGLETYYEDIDYLLDGLLTSNLDNVQNVSSRVLVGKSFDKEFYVMIIWEKNRQELESFLSLFKGDLLPKDEVIVIDQNSLSGDLLKDLKGISSHIRTI